MTKHALAGKPAPREYLVNVPRRSSLMERSSGTSAVGVPMGCSAKGRRGRGDGNAPVILEQPCLEPDLYLT
jgi:hypothetical protein